MENNELSSKRPQTTPTRSGHCPTFTWDAPSYASLEPTDYQLNVQSRTTNAVVYGNLRLDRDDAGCPTGGTCRWTPDASLPLDTYTWSVQLVVAPGLGRLKTGPDFTVMGPLPQGEVVSPAPEFVWEGRGGEADYVITVEGRYGAPSLPPVSVSAIVAGCPTGGVCRFAPAYELPVGTSTWWVQPRDASGASLPPTDVVEVFYGSPDVGVAEILAPVGTAGNVQNFSWKSASYASGYAVSVRYDDTGEWFVFAKPFTAAEAGCDATEVCSVSLGSVPDGEYTWYVQSLAPDQWGTASVEAAFTAGTPVVVTPPAPVVDPTGTIFVDASGLACVDDVDVPAGKRTYATRPDCCAEFPSWALNQCLNGVSAVPPVDVMVGSDPWTSPHDAEVAGETHRAAPSPHVPFGTRIQEQTFAYDWLGNLSQSDDDLHGFYDRSIGDNRHDNAGKPYQLTRADNMSLSDGSYSGELRAEYDVTGNMTSLTVRRDAGCIGDATSVGCSQHFAYRWDEVGRLERAQRWDIDSMKADEFLGADIVPNSGSAELTLADLAADLSYVYDGSDQRRVKTARDLLNETTSHTVYVFASLELRRTAFGPEGADEGTPAGTEDYLRDPWTETVYLFANGVRLARLAYEDGVPSVSGDQPHVFLELGDHLGSTSAVLDLETSELVERSTYQAYGGTESDYRPARWKNFREDYRFTGKEEDVEVGLVYFGKRFLNTQVQRWVSADPLAVHAPGEADLNLYAYVSGRVLRAVDPVGLEEFENYEAYQAHAQAEGLEVMAREDIGSQGHWLEADRTGERTGGFLWWGGTDPNSSVWDQANDHNLANETGFREYQSIEQRAEFYRWFDGRASARGHEVQWAGAAATVADGVAMLRDTGGVMAFALQMNAPPDRVGGEVERFANDGNKAIFNDVFSKLRALDGGAVLTGDAARAWDSRTLSEEQHMVQTAYEGLSWHAKGVVQAVVKQDRPFIQLGAQILSDLPALRGDLLDVGARWEYGMRRMGHNVSASDMSVPADGKYLNGAQYSGALRGAP